MVCDIKCNRKNHLLENFRRYSVNWFIIQLWLFLRFTKLSIVCLVSVVIRVRSYWTLYWLSFLVVEGKNDWERKFFLDFSGFSQSGWLYCLDKIFLFYVCIAQITLSQFLQRYWCIIAMNWIQIWFRPLKIRNFHNLQFCSRKNLKKHHRSDKILRHVIFAYFTA